MKEQHTIYKHPLFDAIVLQYQESNHISSWSSAAMELVLRGFEQWMEASEAEIKWPNQEELMPVYQEWRHAIYRDHGWKERTILEGSDEDKVAFNRFVAEQIVPKHGGRRAGQGRKKGSKNKPKVEAISDYEEF